MTFDLGCINFGSTDYTEQQYKVGYLGYTTQQFNLTITNSVNVIAVKLTNDGIFLKNMRGNSGYNNNYTLSSGWYCFKGSDSYFDRTRISSKSESLISSKPFKSNVLGTTPYGGESTLYLPYTQFGTNSKTYQEQFFSIFKQIDPTDTMFTPTS